MTTYYISYGDPQGRSFWRPLLLILLIILALAVLAAIAYVIYELASGDDSPDTASAAGAAVPLVEALPPLYTDDTNATFLVDTSKSISEGGSLPAVKEALLAVALPYVPGNDGRAARDSRVALVPFTKLTGSLPELTPLEPEKAPEAATQWLSQVRDLKTTDRPAYIYDAVAAAHGQLVHLNDPDRDNVIVLLTDGADGGLGVVDPTRLAPCSVDIPTEPGEVCSPVLDKISVDPAKLVPCPPEVAASPGEVCNPVPVGVAGETIIAYEPVNPADLKPCPSQLGGPDNACYDVVIDYEKVDPARLKSCPPGFAEPGKACMDVQSDLTREGLIALLANSKVPNLKVHIIGLGASADRESLELLATAGKGVYIPAKASER